MPKFSQGCKDCKIRKIKVRFFEAHLIHMTLNEQRSAMRNGLSVETVRGIILACHVANMYQETKRALPTLATRPPQDNEESFPFQDPRPFYLLASVILILYNCVSCTTIRNRPADAISFQLFPYCLFPWYVSHIPITSHLLQLLGHLLLCLLL